MVSSAQVARGKAPSGAGNTSVIFLGKTTTEAYIGLEEAKIQCEQEDRF